MKFFFFVFQLMTKLCLIILLLNSALAAKKNPSEDQFDTTNENSISAKAFNNANRSNRNRVRNDDQKILSEIFDDLAQDIHLELNKTKLTQNDADVRRKRLEIHLPGENGIKSPLADMMKAAEAAENTEPEGAAPLEGVPPEKEAPPMTSQFLEVMEPSPAEQFRSAPAPIPEDSEPAASEMRSLPRHNPALTASITHKAHGELGAVPQPAQDLGTPGPYDKYTTPAPHVSSLAPKFYPPTPPGFGYFSTYAPPVPPYHQIPPGLPPPGLPPPGPVLHHHHPHHLPPPPPGPPAPVRHYGYKTLGKFHKHTCTVVLELSNFI